MSTAPESVNALLSALHAERLASWPPAQLESNIRQRRRLVENADRERFVKTGDRVAPFTLEAHDGSPLHLDDLLRDGPLVLIFFRFAGCPACNLALPSYARTLFPALAAHGATLVAVTPQIPARAAEIGTRHALPFAIATDPDNRLARRFGIAFEPDDATKQSALANGNFIGDTTGTGTWELPMPTALVIDRNRMVRFAEVSPDWMDRAEAGPILDTLDRLHRSVAA